MKKFLFLWLLAAFGLSGAKAQSCQKCCNLIENPVFDPFGTPTSTQKVNPLVDSFFSPWARSHGSPDCVDFTQTVTPGSSHLALMFKVDKQNKKIKRISSEGFSQLVNVVNGKPYVVAVYTRHTSGQYINLEIDLTANKPLGKLPNMNGPFFPTGYGASQNIISENVTNTGWTLYKNCFTANSNYANIWLYSKKGITSKKGESRILVDNIELIENFDFALKDTSICQPGSQVKFRTKCDSFLNFSASYQWRDLNTGNIVGTSKLLIVNPLITTKYECKRILSGLPDCPGYDTVTVTVGGSPIMVDLGPDTTLCAPLSILLDAGFHGSNYVYAWFRNTIDTNKVLGRNQTYLVTKTGNYIVEVTDTTSGCIYRDSVNVIVNPEVKINPETAIICDTLTQFGQFDAGAGFVTYKWDNNATNNSRYFNTNVPGFHIVEVSDINGCIGIDTALLLYRDFKFKLPNDTVICDGECVFVPVKTDSAYTSYLWNDGTSDTSRTICDEGQYILTITDSLGCSYSDTINVYVHYDPNLNLSDYGPICWEDTFLVLIKPVQDDLGYFTGNYVNLDTFWIGTGAAQPGTHKVRYDYVDSTWEPTWVNMDSSACWFFANLNVLVAPLDTIYIDSLGPLCLNAPKQPLVPTPPGGIFKDSSGATLDSFLASNYGVGTHLITYTYIDSNGCDYQVKTWVQVTEPPVVEIKHNNDYCIPCYGTIVWANVDTIEYPSLKYLWSNGATTRATKGFANDTLIVTVYYDDSVCYATDTLIMGLPSCCDLDPSFAGSEELVFSLEHPLNWSNDTLVIDRDILLLGDYPAVIDNCFIVFKCNAKIMIHNEANLLINNSKLGHCDWEGIEVWGNIDACADLDPGIGDLEVLNSEITCANVGILSGKRDYTNNILFDFTYIGGRMDVQNTHFFANYVDIMFTPHSTGEICKCTTTPHGQEFNSKIESCLFDTLSNDPKCYDFVEPILNSIQTYFGSGGALCTPASIWSMNTPPLTTPDPPSRCHIVDLSPYIEYYIYLPGSSISCNDACPRAHWQNSWMYLYPPIPLVPSKKTTYNNTFIGCSFNLLITDCDDSYPAKYLK